jgi:1-acyl-sn-glycerol-3-phosphate acyltransferase
MNTVSLHPYNQNSNTYNFFFHPNHNKNTKILSIIVNIALSIFTLGLYSIAFFVINIRDNYNLKKWKINQDNLSKDSPNFVANTINKDNGKQFNSVDSNQSTDSNALPPPPSTNSVRIFPENTNTNDKIHVDIPEQVKKSLDQIFGIQDVVDKMPTHEEVLEGEFGNIPYPIMKGIDKEGKPLVILKFLIANPEEYYNFNLAKNDRERVEFAIEQNHLKEGEEEIAIQDLKEKSLKRISAEAHYLILHQIYSDGSELLWGPVEHYHQRREPSFFFKCSAFCIDQITHENGEVVESLQDKIPEFQKLFNGEIATDSYDNQWKLLI